MLILSLLSGHLGVTWVHLSTFALCRAPEQTEPVLCLFCARVNQPSGFAYTMYENVIKIRAAVNTVSCLAVTMQFWVEPEKIRAVSVPAQFASAGRCWGWLLTFQPAVTGDPNGDCLVGTASPFLFRCARGAGPRPRCRRG